MFIENVGQFATGARFQVRGGDRTIWLAQDGLWVTLLGRPATGERPARARRDPRSARDPREVTQAKPRRAVHLKVSFPGANPHPRIEPFDRLETRVSYFVGADRAEWRADVPVWRGVRYVDLYPGLDLEVSGEGGRVRQRLVVREGAALDRGRLPLEGAESPALDSGLLCAPGPG